MEIKQTLILETTDSLSKALSQLDESPAVIVTKNGRYYGMIDHHSVGQNVKEPHNTKCETAVIKPPAVYETSKMFDRVDAFLTGHFKALVVIDKNEHPIGITTRVELLKEMLKNKMIPQVQVSEIMSSPVYSVDEKDSVGTVKRLIKEKKARRVIVTRNRNMVGVVSTFDISAWSNRPNLFVVGRKDIKDSVISIDEMTVSQFLRPDVVLVEERVTLDQVVTKMIGKQTSSAIVVADGKPVGVLSSLDVFRMIQEMGKDNGLQINIAGLGEDNKYQYNYIIEKVSHVLDKYKAFNIRNCNVHIKEGKSAFVVNLNFDSDRNHFSVKSEGEFLKACVDEVAQEANIILGKEREKSKPKIKRRED